jgi:hypothetical protein
MMSCHPPAFWMASSASVSTGVWLTTLSKILVRPDILGQRRDVEVADENGLMDPAGLAFLSGPVTSNSPRKGRACGQTSHSPPGPPRRHPRECRNCAGQTGFGVLSLHAYMTAIALGAEVRDCLPGERQPRHDGDTMIALLAKLRDVAVAQGSRRGGGKLSLRTFGFLQAEDIRLPVPSNSGDEFNPQADGVDIPCCN